MYDSTFQESHLIGGSFLLKWNRKGKIKMSDPNVENPNLEGAGTNQTPVSQSKGSSIEGSPSSSQEFLELKREFELAKKELKGLQSRQDKDKNELQRFMEEVKTKVSKGLSLEEAEQAVHADRENARKDDLLNKIALKLGIDDSPQNLTGNKSNAVDTVAQVFNEFGVDPNHPEATALYNLKGEELIKGVAKLAIKTRTTTLPDSSEASSISGSPASSKDESGLISELSNLQKDPIKNRAKIQEIEKELKW